MPKLLGSTQPATSEIGVMTEGLGHPLWPVEDTLSRTVETQEVLKTSSFDVQDPAGLGVALQVQFGAAETNQFFDVSSAGAITCLVAGEYSLNAKFSVARTGGSQGESQLYVRGLLNGSQVGDSVHTIIDSTRIEINMYLEAIRFLDVGDVITCEIIRDSDGNNSGGLDPGVPDVPNWNPAPSASMRITRLFLNE
tara:strand:+ start:1172 stop:1756 length:585 start_codon:yes stop_codon:yes gene_type:complete